MVYRVYEVCQAASQDGFFFFQACTMNVGGSPSRPSTLITPFKTCISSIRGAIGSEWQNNFSASKSEFVFFATELVIPFSISVREISARICSWFTAPSTEQKCPPEYRSSRFLQKHSQKSGSFIFFSSLNHLTFPSVSAIILL